MSKDIVNLISNVYYFAVLAKQKANIEDNVKVSSESLTDISNDAVLRNEQILKDKQAKIKTEEVKKIMQETY